MIKYRLSTTQKKRLLISGEPLRIALPAPDYEPPDGNWLRWARSSIEHHGSSVNGIQHGCVIVTAPRQDAPPRTISETIGPIVHDPDECDTPMKEIPVVVCFLDPPGRPKRDWLTRSRVQWPKDARQGDRVWPEHASTH